MTFTFLDMAGKVLFTRDDAEQAEWTTEEYSLSLEFPYLSDKKVTIGQRVFFKDPATGAHQVYEVKNAQTFQPDSYQSITAEHICISELSDEHIDTKEITDKTAASALSSVLTGTLWTVGKAEVNPKSSGDVSRGSVWQAVLEIKDNWNVYIEPRVSVAADGTITRKLDILSTDGVWNGIRLSIDKNLLDPSVTYDDSEVYTALFGYGGTDPEDTSTDKKETTFEDVVWSKTSSHPAKPKGQKYLEDPTATANYGRNGRARYGFYQNSDITDPNVLLEKTWETLQTVSKPKISIEGTVADLYRLGYADVPLKLHDLALVEVLPSGYKAQIQIIRLTVDLLDASQSTVTIGSYIPNIIYNHRKTNESATGSRGGGGGNSAEDTNSWQEFRTTITALADGTGLQILSVQNDINHQEEEIAIQSARLDVTYEKIEAEVVDRRNADQVLSSTITQTANAINLKVKEVADDVEGLSGEIDIQKDKISLLVTDGANPQIKPASIVAAINNGSSSIVISANHIELDGEAVASSLFGQDLSCDTLNAETAYLGETSVDGNLECTGKLFGVSLRVGEYDATWKSYNARRVQLSTERPFMYGSTSGASGVITGHIAIGYTDTTIYYLGR